MAKLSSHAPRTVLLAEARSILRDELGLDEAATQRRMNELFAELYRRPRF